MPIKVAPLKDGTISLIIFGSSYEEVSDLKEKDYFEVTEGKDYDGTYVVVSNEDSILAALQVDTKAGSGTETNPSTATTRP